MTAKRKWRSRKQELINLRATQTEPNISWSSSSSDEGTPSKIRKVKGSTTKKWIKIEVMPKKKVKVEDFTSKVSEANSLSPSKSSNNSFVESPVIGDLGFERSPIVGDITVEMSPIISQIKHESDCETSPVLGKNKVYKMRKKNKIKRHLTKEDSTSPEHDLACIYEEQLETFHISQLEIASQRSFDFSISQSSITNMQNTEPIVIDSVASQYSEPFIIQPVSTQEKNEVIEESTDYSDHIVYDQVSTKPKKSKCKHGTFVWQLQKALKKQKLKMEIWKHELYLSKVNNTQYVSPDDEELIINFKISAINVEFDNILVECLRANLRSNTNTSSHTKSYPKLNEGSLLIINKTFVKMEDLFLAANIKLYPPYILNEIEYKSNLVNCYFNISKVLI